jgi:hypothetical protein
MWQVWVQQKAALVFYSGYWVLETRTWTLNSANGWICSIESTTPIWWPCWAGVGTRPTFKWFSWNPTRTSIWNRICCRLLLRLSRRGRFPNSKHHNTDRSRNECTSRSPLRSPWRDLGTRNILVAFHGTDNTKVHTIKL